MGVQAEIWSFLIDILPDFLRDYGPLISPTLTVPVTGWIAWTAFRTNAAVNLRNKRIDVIMGCNSRYDELSRTKAHVTNEAIALSSLIDGPEKEEKHREIEAAVNLYYKRFWGLQSDQIDYWLAGYVDPETLISWFMSTIDTVHTPDEAWTAYPSAKKAGWKEVRLFHQVTNFRLFQIAEEITKYKYKKMGQSARYASILIKFEQIENEERIIIDILGANNHERFSMPMLLPALPDNVVEAHARITIPREDH